MKRNQINISSVLNNYKKNIKNELTVRWNIWEKDLTKSHIYEVIGGILSRQTSLAMQLSLNPNIWNAEIAPLILRSMVDNHINLAWVLINPDKNSENFILYGLGQLKLELEHRKMKMKEENIDENHSYIRDEENFIHSQRYSFITEVNLGSWSGISTRKMAEEANLLDFYNYVYQPFSNCTHNTWGHISKYNNIPSSNPFHKFLRQPRLLEFYPDFNYMELAAKYLIKSFNLFDEKYQFGQSKATSFEKLLNEFDIVINNKA